MSETFEATETSATPVTSATSGRPSMLDRYGLSLGDAGMHGFLFFYVVAFIPVLSPVTWSGRGVLVYAVLPFGCVALVRGVQSRQPVFAVTAGLIGWSLVSGLLAVSPTVSILGGVGREEHVLLLTAGLGAWAIGRQMSPEGKEALGVAFVVACLLNALVGFLQVLFVVRSGDLALFSSGRPTGFSVNPVHLGALTAGAVAWMFQRATRADDPDRTSWFFVGASGFATMVVALSGSRAALSAVVLAGIVLVVKRRNSVSWATVAASLLGVLVAPVIHRATVGTEASATERLTSGGIGVRLDLWRYGWDAFRDRPVLGHGLGQFRTAIQGYFEPEFVEKYVDEKAWFDSHNLVVEYAVGLGIVGLAIATVFAWLALRDTAGGALWAVLAIGATWSLQPAGMATFPVLLALLGVAHRDVSQRRGHGIAASGTLRRWQGRCDADDVDRLAARCVGVGRTGPARRLAAVAGPSRGVRRREMVQVRLNRRRSGGNIRCRPESGRCGEQSDRPRSYSPRHRTRAGFADLVVVTGHPPAQPQHGGRCQGIVRGGAGDPAVPHHLVASTAHGGGPAGR